jgi:pimeloyl-ACP methyl ester carboxylesterase
MNAITPTSTETIMNHRMHRANGVLLHYVTAGQGEPVVLLHGFAQTWYEWKRSVIPALAEKYHVIAPDMRGVGDSERPMGGYDKRTMAEDIWQLVQHLGLKKAMVIGMTSGARSPTRLPPSIATSSPSSSSWK